MGNRVASEIWIGGQLNRRFVPALCAAIRADQVGLDWAAPAFEPVTEAELLDGLNIYDNAQVLHLMNCQAKFGTFREIEEFSQRHKLQYCRLSGSSDCENAAVIHFRPGREPTVVTTTSGGFPVITEVEKVGRALQLLKQADSLMRVGDRDIGLITAAADLLEQALPPAAPRLEPFQIMA